MRVVTADAVRRIALRVLELSSDVSQFGSSESVAAMVRRAASFLAPCPARVIREAVLASSVGLEPNDEYSVCVDETIEALVAYGDFLELPARDEEASGTLLYLAPMSFVRRQSGTVFLLGVSPDGVSAVPESLRKRIRHVRHTRRIDATPGEDLPRLLLQFHLNEVPEALWRRRPRLPSPVELLNEFDAQLAYSQIRGDVAGLLVLDPARDVRFYRGRWAPPGKLTGRFLARREQRYGSPLWSYVELADGVAVRLIDIPATDSATGADRAWHLQMAIDYVRGTPQRFTASLTEDRQGTVMCFYSPVPKWAQHRWELLGERTDVKGCLFAYRIPASEYRQEQDLLLQHLWLQEG